MSERECDIPPPDWKPKSEFFKSIMAKADLSAYNKKWHLQCPDCGHHIDLEVRIPDPLLPQH